MSESMIQPVELEIGGRTFRLKYSIGRAAYRIGAACKGVDNFTAIVNSIWAMSVKRPFDSPDDLAEWLYPLLTPDVAERINEAIGKCIKQATVADDDKESTA